MHEGPGSGLGICTEDWESKWNWESKRLARLAICKENRNQYRAQEI